jgi:hypothetical protein
MPGHARACFCRPPVPLLSSPTNWASARCDVWRRLTPIRYRSQRLITLFVFNHPRPLRRGAHFTNCAGSAGSRKRSRRCFIELEAFVIRPNLKNCGTQRANHATARLLKAARSSAERKITPLSIQRAELHGVSASARPAKRLRLSTCKSWPREVLQWRQKDRICRAFALFFTRGSR